MKTRAYHFGRLHIWITLIVAAAVAGMGILAGKELFLMIETAIALAIALARGIWRMAKRNALINQLSAVENLDAASVICTDKTGTLTENRMAVRHLIAVDADTEVDDGEGASAGRRALGPTQRECARDFPYRGRGGLRLGSKDDDHLASVGWRIHGGGQRRPGGSPEGLHPHTYRWNRYSARSTRKGHMA